MADPIWVSVQADGATFDMEVDTGTSSSVITEATCGRNPVHWPKVHEEEVVHIQQRITGRQGCHLSDIALQGPSRYTQTDCGRSYIVYLYKTGWM